MPPFSGRNIVIFSDGTGKDADTETGVDSSRVLTTVDEKAAEA